MPVKYDRAGIRFLYPDNWEIADETSDEQTRSVLVQAPGGAFWSVDLCLQAMDSDILAAQVLQAMQQDYSDLEAEPVTDQIGGRKATGYDMQFYCLDFLVSAKVRSFSACDRKYVVFSQAEDREFEEIDEVFLAITTTLIRALNRSEGLG